MARPRADRDAILIAFLDELGGRLPSHFDLERFGAEADRWAAQGLTTKQIAQLLAEQCRACAPPEAQPVERLFHRRSVPSRGGTIPRRRARSRLRGGRDEAPNQSRRPAAARLCPDLRGNHPAPSPRPPRLHPSHRQKTRLGHTKSSEHRPRLSKTWISMTTDPPAAYPRLG